MNSKELIYHINPPKYLSVLIAYTLASDILHIFEEKYPNDLRPRKALDLVKWYLDGEKVSGKELKSAAAAIAARWVTDAGYAAAAAANAAAYDAYADNDTVCAAYAATAARWAIKATSEEHAVNLIYSMMPKLIDYAIKSQVRLFNGPGDFTEVFDKLDDETREKVVWNMELLTNIK